MKRRARWCVVVTIGIFVILSMSSIIPSPFALEGPSVRTETGIVRGEHADTTPPFETPLSPSLPHPRTFLRDDGQAEIYLGAESGDLVVANRFVSARSVTLRSISFVTGGNEADDLVEIVVYEDISGIASCPDPSMEVGRTEVVLGQGGLQEVEIGEIRLNALASPGAVFFVGVTHPSSRRFSLGIDTSGPKGYASFFSEDGGLRFSPLSELPVVDGNAVIRASEAPPNHRYRFDGQLQGRRIHAGQTVAHPASALSSSATTRRFLHFERPGEETIRSEPRATLINDRIEPSSGSESCPGCTPALTPGYPRFTLGAPDLYEDYVTIENSSGAGIPMDIRTIMGTLAPETVEGFNTDGGGTRPPTGFWEYSALVHDGTESVDDVLDPGEKVTRLWRIADEGGGLFTFWVDAYSYTDGVDAETVLMLHGDGDASGSAHDFEIFGNPRLDGVTKVFGPSSIRFDGSGSDFVELQSSDDWNFGTGDFTIDFRIRFNALGNFPLIDMGGSLGQGLFIRTNEVGSNQFNVYIEAERYTWAWAWTTGRFYHIAIVRNGDTLTLYVDGTSQGNHNIAGRAIPSGILRIGEITAGGTYQEMNGFIDEVRFSTGVARWTSDFTPPMSPYVSDANTTLLLHFDGDASDSGHTMTFNGDPTVSNTVSKWDGSYAFDGNGDYVTVPDSDDWDFGSADFTIDFWVRSTAAYQMPCMLNKAACGVPGDQAFVMFLNSGAVDGRVRITFFDAAQDRYDLWSVTPVTGGPWHHLATVRNGRDLSLYIDGNHEHTIQLPAEDTVMHENDMDLEIGVHYNQGTCVNNYFQGNLDELRVSKGIARWTSDFAPPVAPYE